MKNNDIETYKLTDENGVETLYELLDVLEEDGQKYFELVPHESEDDYPLILKEIIKDGEKILSEIEDDEEFEKIGAIFAERLEK